MVRERCVDLGVWERGGGARARLLCRRVGGRGARLRVGHCCGVARLVRRAGVCLRWLIRRLGSECGGAVVCCTILLFGGRSRV